MVSELRGERIDVIQWSEDPTVYVANALSPAKVSRVLIDEVSLAIGKEGQNARLAARLTGWHIDIKSASIVSADMLQASDRSFIDDDDEAEEADTRCEHVSADGVRCRNHARPGSSYCGVHAADEESLI